MHHSPGSLPRSDVTQSPTDPSARGPRIELASPPPAGAERVLSPAALAFIEGLVRTHRPRIAALLAARRDRQAARDRGEPLAFLESTKAVRTGDWKVAPLPRDLLDRRVEITGPIDRKMVINALNSGANVFMADFEDATSPTWENVVRGQHNLIDAVDRSIGFEDPATHKRYELAQNIATLLVRPRGLHLPERHVLVDGEVAPGCLVDFGLYFFHNAKNLLKRGTGPYFYLPKMESHLEARLWNDVFVDAQRALGVPNGTIKATVLIETLPAAFEMDEILYELRDHAAGLNCGRWDYIFSYIKTLRAHADHVLPDRSVVTMDQPMMRAYTQLVVKTCHRRGAFAMGGMAAQIPVKNDPVANEAALTKVRADKQREVGDGHDGTWVAHPGLVSIARDIFDASMNGRTNQLDILRETFSTTAGALVETPKGARTLEGLRHNVRVGVQYIEAWLHGQGCVPLYNLMEDAATAEISRSQVWQWLRHGADVEGERLTTPRFRTLLAEEMQKLEGTVGKQRFREGRFDEARDLFDKLSTSAELADFLTLEAYDRL
ncbi:MAG: malate synthase A [Polyangiaceae bacterium]|nr:malate synthase A [Polyangiaceae bacterium]